MTFGWFFIKVLLATTNKTKQTNYTMQVMNESEGFPIFFHSKIGKSEINHFFSIKQSNNRR